MGLVVTGREDSDKLVINLDDLDLELNLVGLDINLDAKGTVLLREAIMKNSSILVDNGNLKIADFEVLLDEEWSKALNELLNYDFILKNNDGYIVTNKGLEYYYDNY